MEILKLKDVKMVIEKAKVKDDCIVIAKKDIEEWVNHYEKIGKELMENGCPTWQTWFYWGKREVLVDLLKQIEGQEA